MRITKEQIEKIINQHKIMTIHIQQQLLNMGGDYIEGFSIKLPYGSKDIKEFELDGERYLGVGLRTTRRRSKRNPEVFLTLRRCIAFRLN